MNEEWEFGARYPGVAATAADVWRHKWLLRLVALRAFQRMYRRTVLGSLWLVINPLLPLMVNVVVFGILLGVESNGLPYFLFLLGGSIAWDLFAGTLMRATRALEMHRVLSDLIYYPRAILPFGNIAPQLVDLGIKVGVFIATLTYYVIRDGQLYLRLDVGLGWAFCALLLALMFALSLSFFTSVWGETTRDMRFALGQITDVWYMLTPVLYPLSQVPEKYHAWIALNPMAIIVETFKWGVFGVGEFRPLEFGGTAVAICALFLLGLMYFTRTEAQTIDAR
jgi:lipopolysaccharide transport system permease protein